MKTIVLALAVVVQSSLLFAQIDTDKLLQGTWAVSEAKATLGPDLIPAEGANIEGQLIVIENMLLESKFIFDEKNVFTYDCPDGETRIDDGVWTLTDKNIKVTNVSDGDDIKTLMDIEILSIDETEAKVKVKHDYLFYTLTLTK